MASSEKMRVGVVGVGKMGELHVRKYAELLGPERVSIFDSNRDRVSLISQKYGVKALPSLAELLFEVDGVSIASSTEAHYNIARQAFDSGTHVLLEKPIAQTIAEGDELVRLAEAKQLIFQVGFLERFRYQALTRGFPPSPILFIESDRLSSALSRESTIDVVSDLMIHDLDLALSLVPEEPSFVSAIGVPVITPLVDLANARIEFPGGAVVNLNASRVSEKPIRKFRVFSRDYYVSVDLISNSAELFRRGQDLRIERSSTQAAELDALRLQCEDFVRCIENQGQPLVSGRDGLRALRIAKWIRENIAQRASSTPSSQVFARPELSADEKPLYS